MRKILLFCIEMLPVGSNIDRVRRENVESKSENGIRNNELCDR